MPATSSHSASAGLTDGHASWMSRSSGIDDDAAEQHRHAEGGRQDPRRAEGYPLESGPARRVETIPFVHTPLIGARRVALDTTVVR